MSGLPVSVMILTHNEAANIAGCLSSVDWADDVVVVDSGSSDRTVDAAKASRTDVRVFEHPFRDFGEQRNWALDNTSPRHDWVLFLDADEHCTPELKCKIEATVRNPGEHVGYYLAPRNMFLGRWIKRCTLYPSWQLRLLKRGEVRFRKEGHGQREVTTGSLGYIREPYDHYMFSKGVADWITRHNRYSTEELELILRLQDEALALSDLFRGGLARRRCLKRVMARIGCRPLLQFVYMYFLRGGFLDGRAGWQYCLLRATHEAHITAKLAERRSAQKPVAND